MQALIRVGGSGLGQQSEGRTRSGVGPPRGCSARRTGPDRPEPAVEARFRQPGPDNKHHASLPPLQPPTDRAAPPALPAADARSPRAELGSPWCTATVQPCPSQYTSGFSAQPRSSEHTQQPPTISRMLLPYEGRI